MADSGQRRPNCILVDEADKQRARERREDNNELALGEDVGLVLELLFLSCGTSHRRAVYGPRERAIRPLLYGPVHDRRMYVGDRLSGIRIFISSLLNRRRPSGVRKAAACEELLSLTNPCLVITRVLLIRNARLGSLVHRCCAVQEDLLRHSQTVGSAVPACRAGYIHA